MLITTNLSVSGPLSLSSVASTTTSLSAMILESGLVKSRPLGSMSLKGDNEYLPQIGLSFPSIFNLNTNALNFANQSLTVSLANQTANTFLSAPNGLSGTPSFRAIVPSDIPTLNQSTTGNAATATSLQTTRTINGVGFNGTSNILITNLHSATDNRSVDTIPNDYNSKFDIKGLKTNSVIGVTNGGTYSAVLGIRGWTDSSGGNAHEFAFDGNGGIRHRHGATTTWSSWSTLLNSSNYTTYSPSLNGTGATGTWGISITGNAATATNLGITNTTTSGTYYPLFASATSGNQAARVNTGLTYNPGTNTFNIAGSIGVGTTLPPIRSLQIGNYTSNPEIHIASSTTSTGALVFGDSALGNDPWRGFIQYNHNGDFMTIGTTNLERIRIDSVGNVVIGATTAGARLNVKAQGALSTDIVFRVINSTETVNFLVVNGAGDVYNNGANGIKTNTFFGENVGRLTTAPDNAAFGLGALQHNTTGGYTTAIGTGAGRFINSGGNNEISNNSVFIGYDTRANANNETNQIVIGASARGLGSNTAVLGNASITTTQLRGQVIMGSFDSPPTGIDGAIYYDTTEKKHFGFDGTTWNPLY